MSFDPRSLEYLREIGRKLPQELPKPKSSHKKESSKKIKQHPIETETNPQNLFKELIKASPDGNVTKHLINKLKEVEYQQQGQNSDHKANLVNHIASSDAKPISKNSSNKNASEEEILYTSFAQFLLEEED